MGQSEGRVKANERLETDEAMQRQEVDPVSFWDAYDRFPCDRDTV